MLRFHDDWVKILDFSLIAYFWACVTFYYSVSKYEVGRSWEYLKRNFDPDSMMDGVIHSNIFLCVGTESLDKLKSSKLVAQSRNPYKFDRFKFSRFHFLWSLAVLFLDSAPLFDLYQNHMAFWPQTPSFSFEWYLTLRGIHNFFKLLSFWKKRVFQKETNLKNSSIPL